MTISVVLADAHHASSDGLAQAIAARDDLEIVGVVLAGRDVPTARRLLLTSVDTPAVIVEAIAQGIEGYMLKDTAGDAITAVAAGRIVLAPRPREDVDTGLHNRRKGDQVLSGRERRVLQLTADGMSSVRVGEALHLSRASVKAHLRGIYRKLGVSERAAAVAVGMRSGLLE